MIKGVISLGPDIVFAHLSVMRWDLHHVTKQTKDAVTTLLHMLFGDTWGRDFIKYGMHGPNLQLWRVAI